MAENTRPPAPQPFNGRELWRLGFWGLGAAAAVSVALVIASSDVGVDRSRPKVATVPPGSTALIEAALQQKAEESRHLSEAVQKLASDRDRLQTRLGRLEQNLADVTGALSKVSEKLAATTPAGPSAPAQPTPPQELTAVQPPQVQQSSPPVQTAASPPSTAQTSFFASAGPPQSPPSAVPPTYVLLEPALGFNRPPAPSVASDIWSKIPVPQPAPSRSAEAPVQSPTDTATDAAPTGSIAEYGVDLGGAPTMEGLRALWTAATAKYGNALASLRPVAQMRDAARPGNVELRLVAGPLSTAANAARLCAMLAVNGASCQPAVFDGQRLVLR